MRRGKPYKLSRIGKLLRLDAAVGGGVGNVGRVRLLLDTGASYSMLPLEALEALGYAPHQSNEAVRLFSANGIILAPVVRLSWFNCLGQTLKNFPVVAHTIPSGIPADGLLGMDFLSSCGAVISIADAGISFKSPKS